MEERSHSVHSNLDFKTSASENSDECCANIKTFSQRTKQPTNVAFVFRVKGNNWYFFRFKMRQFFIHIFDLHIKNSNNKKVLKYRIKGVGKCWHIDKRSVQTSTMETD